jgi:hypothetical protein
MSLPPEFWKQLPERSDADLYDMLSHPDDYQPEALSAATGELQKRNLSPVVAAELACAARAKKGAEEAQADEPLSWPMRLVVFACILTLCGGLPFALFYHIKGYKRKFREVWIVYWVALGIWITFSIISHLAS